MVDALHTDQKFSFRRSPQDGIGAMALAAVLNAPALTVPIGQVEYESRVSPNTEHLPLTVPLIWQRGTYLFLLDAAREILEATGLATALKTGWTMFGASE